MRFSSGNSSLIFWLVMLSVGGRATHQQSSTDVKSPRRSSPQMVQDGSSAKPGHKRTEAEKTARRLQLIDEGLSVNQIVALMRLDDLKEELEAEKIPGEAFKQGEYGVVVGPSFLSEIPLYTSENVIDEWNASDSDRRYAIWKEMERVGKILNAYKDTKVLVIADSKEFQLDGKTCLLARVKLLETFKKGEMGWIETRRLKRIAK